MTILSFCAFFTMGNFLGNLFTLLSWKKNVNERICITAAPKQLSLSFNKLPWPIRIPHSEHCIFVWTFFKCTCRSFTSVAQCGHIFFSFEWVIRCLPKFRVYEKNDSQTFQKTFTFANIPHRSYCAKRRAKKGGS